MKHQSIATSNDETTCGAMSVDGFCKWACIGRTKVYAEAKAGRLILRKIGAKTVILRADAEAWLRALPAASSPAV